jgi:predicted nucleic acid-binding protein
VIVVDTNILVYLVLPGDFTSAAEALFQKDPVWIAPWLWRSEFRNVLALYVRQKLLTLQEALDIQTAAERLMSGNEFQIESHDVLKLAADSGEAAYDCEFVALAHRLGVPLVTADKKLLRAFPNVAVALGAA